MELSAGLRRETPFDPAELGQDEALAARIREEIGRAGPITFARFMELALYDPDGGYYRTRDARPGRTGDYLTAPEAHPIFGRAVAAQLVEIWERLGRPDPFMVHEHGAGTGTLAVSILDELRRTGTPLLASIRYVPIEIDAQRTADFGARLAGAGHGDRLGDETTDHAFDGVVLANEVLDALPVHRVAVREGRLLERFVGSGPDGAFVDTWGQPSSAALADRLAAEGVALREGQAAEISLGLDRWVATATGRLRRGLLVLIDYGAFATDLYDAARRPDGTIRAFGRHRLLPDPYAHVGRQDLTAHVDFSAVDVAARSAGLTLVGSTSQSEFLIGSGVEDMLRAVQADPTTTLEAYVALRSALVRLIDPAGMGGYRVVAYGRRWPDGPPLAGFAFRARGRP